jgi:hypothetical protein
VQRYTGYRGYIGTGMQYAGCIGTGYVGYGTQTGTREQIPKGGNSQVARFMVKNPY